MIATNTPEAPHDTPSKTHAHSAGLSSTLQELTANKPAVALAIAVLAGAVLGWLWKRR